ncbi:hypothetical protein GUJ93_ZPchr0014g47270 [Zizania palustris]|uniref:Uncharacterized protein n=1 Tax=Zizania palustris TaxID=103762 RepID=A0A8J5SWF8_ZIZPA|nr:hypothetical protein GUJ93_ZPchr0014g47270 [Zizania palustris]
MELLTVSNTIAALAKLLCFIVVFPAGDLHHATAIRSIHLLFISSVSSHLAFFYNTIMCGLASSSSVDTAIELFTVRPCIQRGERRAEVARGKAMIAECDARRCLRASMLGGDISEGLGVLPSLSVLLLAGNSLTGSV